MANRVNSILFLESLPYARWFLAGAFAGKYFQCISILASVLFVLYREPMWSSGKTLAANAGGREFESHRGHNNLFFTFYSIRVECEELFCKTNIKLLKRVYAVLDRCTSFSYKNSIPSFRLLSSPLV